MTTTKKTITTHGTTKLGATGPEVSRLALGCMGLSGTYGAVAEDDAVRLIEEAIDRGVTLLDTGDFYDMGENERLLRRAIAGRRDRVTLSVKFGALRAPDGRFIGFDARPEAVKNFAAYSLRRLGVEVIDVYRPARLDPSVPIEETIGAIADLVKAGYVRHIGLSEVGVETIRRAHAVHPIADLQIEYSLVSRKPETQIFPALAELGISATLYGVLSRGLLTGSRPAAAGDYRAHLPRFTGSNREKNDQITAALKRFADERRMTPAQLAIAWVLARQPSFVPVIGAKRPSQLEDALGALDKPLSASDAEALEALVSEREVAGTRYDAAQMAHLDSEH
jgi:aryl-alcohol dehydrogenase-like predicted oxidoreductase